MKSSLLTILSLIGLSGASLIKKNGSSSIKRMNVEELFQDIYGTNDIKIRAKFSTQLGSMEKDALGKSKLFEREFKNEIEKENEDMLRLMKIFQDKKEEVIEQEVATDTFLINEYALSRTLDIVQNPTIVRTGFRMNSNQRGGNHNPYFMSHMFKGGFDIRVAIPKNIKFIGRDRLYYYFEITFSSSIFSIIDKIDAENRMFMNEFYKTIINYFTKKTAIKIRNNPRHSFQIRNNPYHLTDIKVETDSFQNKSINKSKIRLF